MLSIQPKNIAKYDVFIDLLDRLAYSNILQIHTLNHDLLFEKLMENKLTDFFCDGFRELGSKFYGVLRTENNCSNKKFRIRHFNNKFDKEINLYKLHGSIDNFIYRYQNTSNVDLVKRLPGMTTFDFYKEIKTKDGVLDYHNSWIEYDSYFLSGVKTKVKQFNFRYINKPIFNRFKKNLGASNKLIIIGYGFMDEGINGFIKKYFLINPTSTMLVINPTKIENDIFRENRDTWLTKKFEDIQLEDFNSFLDIDITSHKRISNRSKEEFLEMIGAIE